MISANELRNISSIADEFKESASQLLSLFSSGTSKHFLPGSDIKFCLSTKLKSKEQKDAAKCLNNDSEDIVQVVKDNLKRFQTEASEAAVKGEKEIGFDFMIPMETIEAIPENEYNTSRQFFVPLCIWFFEFIQIESGFKLERHKVLGSASLGTKDNNITMHIHLNWS